jgi:2'-5' RNA ligase
MAEEQKYALWFRPFGDTAFKLKYRIKELAQKFNSPVFEPHITILSGLNRGQTDLTQLTDTLAGSLAPFTVELTELGYRDDYYQSFFARVKKTDAFMHAQDVGEKLFGCQTDEEYFPHLSLMYGHADDKAKRKLLHTVGPSLNLSFPVHSLLLIKTEGEVGDWEKIHTAEFKLK